MVSKVQQATSASAACTITGVTAGNLLVIQVSYYRSAGSTPTNPTDSNGTVSVAANPAPQSASWGSTGSSIWYVANAAAGSHTITPEAVINSYNVTVIEFSGVATSTPLDVSTSAGTSDSTITSQVTGTTGTTAQADELVVIGLGLAAQNGSTDVGFTDPVSGFTTNRKVSNDSSDIATFHAHKVISSTGTQSATFNWTDNEGNQSAQAVIATFKAAAAASAPGDDGTGWPMLADASQKVPPLVSVW